MSNKIGGRPPGGGDIPRPSTVDETQEAQPKAPAQPEAVATPKEAPVDKFERKGANVGAQLQSRLQALAGKVGAGQASKVQFSNEDLAYLANTFASLIKENPNTSRTKRARLFTKAILKRKRLRKVFAGMSENQMEEMCDSIGDVLDSSPVFGQLVDNVTDEAGKLNS
jgi:hypothetical protein